MSESTERAVVRALDPYARALRDLKPTPGLDERMGTAIETWARQNRSRSVLRRPLAWVVAAASVAVVTGGIALLMARDGQGDEIPVVQLAASPTPTPLRMSPLAAGQVSLYPAESAIFRVKASFASPVSALQGGEAAGERQYWVDVRIASDGTMRIMQVIPAERGRVVPRE